MQGEKKTTCSCYTYYHTSLVLKPAIFSLVTQQLFVQPNNGTGLGIQQWWLVDPYKEKTEVDICISKLVGREICLLYGIGNRKVPTWNFISDLT